MVGLKPPAGGVGTGVPMQSPQAAAPNLVKKCKIYLHIAEFVIVIGAAQCKITEVSKSECITSN